MLFLLLLLFVFVIRKKNLNTTHEVCQWEEGKTSE